MQPSGLRSPTDRYCDMQERIVNKTSAFGVKLACPERWHLRVRRTWCGQDTMSALRRVELGLRSGLLTKFWR